MRKIYTGLMIAASALALAGCEKKAEEPAAVETAAATEAAAPASDAAAAADASAAASDTATAAASTAADPNGNPIKP